MPKKGKKGGGKEEEQSKTVLLGRPGNHVKMAIVGMPNVGKSSFFNAVCKVSIPAENFPFCTIDPNEAKVEVPDKRFNHLVEVFHPRSVVPAVLTINDVAGLVRGASEGAGLGNEFLSHIYACDGIYHMVRTFSDSEVTHVEGSVDPVRDMEIIHAELRQKDRARVDSLLAAAEKKLRSDKKAAEEEIAFLNKCKEHLGAEKDIRCGTWKAGEIERLNQCHFLTAKPVIYLVNMKKKSFFKKGGKALAKVAEWVKARSDDKIIPFSVKYEQELIDAGDGAESIIATTGAKSQLPKIVKAGYSGLNLIHFFTCGEDEVRAWTVKKNTLAPQAAGVIHTDFEKGFIQAEVMSYKDFKAHGNTEAGCRAAGRLRSEGRKYVVQDGDIMHFKHNASKSKKK